MTREEAIWWVNHLFEIRKEEYFNKGMMEDAKEVEEAQHIVIYALSADRPAGEWMLEEYKSRNHIENFYICSSCRNFEAWGKTELYNYCPNCGAKMKGGDTE